MNSASSAVARTLSLPPIRILLHLSPSAGSPLSLSHLPVCLSPPLQSPSLHPSQYPHRIAPHRIAPRHTATPSSLPFLPYGCYLPFLPPTCTPSAAPSNISPPPLHAQPRRMSPARSTDISHRPRHSRNPSRAHPAPQHPSQYSAAPAHPSSSMPSPLNASINGSRTPGFGRVAHTSPQEGRQVTTDVPPSSCSTTDSVYDRSSSTTSTVSRYAPRRAPPSAGSRHGPGPASSHLSPASIPSSTAMVLAAHSDAATIHLYNVPPQGACLRIACSAWREGEEARPDA